MAQNTRDIDEIQSQAVETAEPVSSTPPVSGVQHTHPDPEREQYLVKLVDDTWPDIEETIHFLGDHDAAAAEPTPPASSMRSENGYRHPAPDREREVDALLQRAWPRIKASMEFLRDK